MYSECERNVLSIFLFHAIEYDNARALPPGNKTKKQHVNHAVDSDGSSRLYAVLGREHCHTVI